MAEPSLSEVLSAGSSADPEKGSGTPAVVIDTKPVVNYIGQAAQQRQENDWRKYNLFLNNLKDVYKEAGDINSMEVASQDREGLRKKMGDVLQKISENPRGFFTGGAEMMEVQKGLADLKGQATESKMNNTYDMAHREFLTRNPQFATPDNMKKVDAYLGQPLGARKSFLLQPQPILDFDKLSASINGIVGKNFSVNGFTGVDQQGNRTAGNQYLLKEKGREYDPNRYLQLVDQSYDYPGEYGIKNRQAAEQAYSQLPPDVQKAYGSPKQWYTENMMARFKERDIQDSTLTPNKFAEMSEKQQFDYAMEAYKEKDREKLAGIKHHLSMSGAPANVNFLIRQYSSVLGNTTGEKAPLHLPEEGKDVKEDVLDVSPDLLKKMALDGSIVIKKGSGKSGETDKLTREPDALTRTDNGDIRAIYYGRYKQGDKHPNGKKPGDIITTSDGGDYIENSIVIPKRQMMIFLGKDVIEKKNFPSYIDAADGAFKSKGNVNSYIDSINKGDEGQEEGGQNKEGTGNKSVPSSAGKKSYSLNGKKYSVDQITKAAQQSGLSVEEYIQKAGLK